MSNTQQPAEISEAIKVEFDLSPQTVVGYTRRQVDEDSWSDEPVTLAETVATIIARQLTDRIHKQVSQTMEWRDLAAEAIDKAAATRVESALSKVTQPTDVFGTPKGEAKTVAELIDDKLEAWFTATKTGGSSFDGRQTNIQSLIAQAVDRQMQTAMAQVVAEAKKQVLAAMTAEANKQLTAALAGIVQKSAGL